MEGFFEVTDLETVLSLRDRFRPLGTEQVALADAVGRVLAEDLAADADLPPFPRATMDGYAVRAASTFGAGDGSPAFLTVLGSVEMGAVPAFTVGPGQAVRIATGGMLPEGADSVVMIEHCEALDAGSIEICRSVAPGQHVIPAGEDAAAGEVLLRRGRRIRPQDAGLLAALGHSVVPVALRPRVAILSTGDEIVPVESTPAAGKIRDVNSTTLAGLAAAAGAEVERLGIVGDDFEELLARCHRALETCHSLLISGGSSVGQRDYTTRVLAALPEGEILVHGISIAPGKPTILARSRGCALWGLPGHVVSAMVVFTTVVRPFLDHLAGVRASQASRRIPAVISRNVASAQGRVDFVRVRLEEREGKLWAVPVLGKSGLIRTMVAAEGLVAVDINTEGLDAGTPVSVIPF